jgi:hypothetical protein
MKVGEIKRWKTEMNTGGEACRVIIVFTDGTEITITPATGFFYGELALAVDVYDGKKVRKVMEKTPIRLAREGDETELIEEEMNDMLSMWDDGTGAVSKNRREDLESFAMLLICRLENKKIITVHER